MDFVSSADVEVAAQGAGLDAATTTAIVDDYEAAQIRSFKAGLLAAVLIALASLAFTRDLPHGALARRDETETGPEGDANAEAVA